MRRKTSDRCSSVSILHSLGDLSSLNLKNIGALIILSFVQPWNFTSATSSGLTQTVSLFVYGTYLIGHESTFIFSNSLYILPSVSKSNPLPLWPTNTNSILSLYIAKRSDP